MKESVGRKIKKLRESKGLTQRELADAIGVTDQAVSNWERGLNEPRLTLSQVQKLLAVLEMGLENDND